MHDLRGVPLSASDPGSLDGYESALRAFNTYRGDPVAIIDQTLQDDPGFVMGHVLRAHVHVTMWEKSVVPAIETSLGRLRELDNRSNERERAHVRALRRWASGDWRGYKDDLDRLLAEQPRDLLALQAGHI